MADINLELKVSQQVNIQALNELREKFSAVSSHFNKYYYMEAPKLDLNAIKKQKNKEKVAVDEIDEAELQRRIADEVARVEKQNLNADKEALKTDWTDNDFRDADARPPIVENAPVMDYEGNWDKIPITDETDYLANIQDLDVKLPAADNMPADAYAQFADEIIKRSAIVFNSMVASALSVIDQDRSCIRVYSKLMTYPTSRVILCLSPRNCFDQLPRLQKRDTFESQLKFEEERRKILVEMAETLCREVNCQVNFGQPSYGPVLNLDFEPSMDFHSTGSDVPEVIKQLRRGMEENNDIMLQSVESIPVFWVMQYERSKVIEGHTSFVKTSKELIARGDQQAKENIAAHTSVITLAIHIPVADPNQEAAKKGEDFLKTYSMSDNLKIVSAHPLAIDKDSAIFGNKVAERATMDTYFDFDKKLMLETNFPWETGMIDLRKKEFRDTLSDKTYQFVNKIKLHGSFFKSSDQCMLSLRTTDPRFKHTKEEDQTCSKVALPTFTFGFRMLEDVFESGVVSIGPRLEAFYHSNAIHSFMNGLLYGRKAGDSSADLYPCRIVLPNRLFSHCMLQVHKMDGKFKIGFGNDTKEFIRIDLNTGTVDDNLAATRKVKPLLTVSQKTFLKTGDQVILHYFYKDNGKKKLQVFLLIKLVRQDEITEVASLEVPEDPFQLVCWLGDPEDCISVIRSRMNTLNITSFE